MSSSTSPVRTVDGIEVPAAGTYQVDGSHSYVGFSVRHLAVAKVRGRFAEFTGTIEVAEDPLASRLEVSIDPNSIDTRDDQRDGHLRSADFFDTENHPSITYRSTGIRSDAKGGFVVDGDMTIRGVTRPVPLSLTYNGSATDPWGNARFGFEARAEVNREDFDLTWNQALETGGVLVGKKVTIEIEGEAVRS